MRADELGQGQFWLHLQAQADGQRDLPRVGGAELGVRRHARGPARRCCHESLGLARVRVLLDEHGGHRLTRVAVRVRVGGHAPAARVLIQLRARQHGVHALRVGGAVNEGAAHCEGGRA